MTVTTPTRSPAAMAVTTPPTIVWVTWERQRRNSSLASALGARLFEFDFHGSRPARYLRAIPATVWTIARMRPRVLIVQNPSMVLALLGVALSRLARFRLIVDAHNAGLQPDGDAGRLRRFLASFIARRAHVTIVTNPALKRVVGGYGGRAFVLPDGVPLLPPGRVPEDDSGRRRVLVVCSYSPDEPYEAILRATSTLDPETAVFVTGRMPAPAERHLREMASAQVVFTGFLPEDDYVGQLRACDVVVDLTSRDACLVCGAYEATAAGKPMVLSDSLANRSYFDRGAVYTAASPAAIAAAIRQAIDSRERLTAEVRCLETRLRVDFHRRARHLSRYLRQLASGR